MARSIVVAHPLDDKIYICFNIARVDDIYILRIGAEQVHAREESQRVATGGWEAFAWGIRNESSAQAIDGRDTDIKALVEVTQSHFIEFLLDGLAIDRIGLILSEYRLVFWSNGSTSDIDIKAHVAVGVEVCR